MLVGGQRTSETRSKRERNFKLETGERDSSSDLFSSPVIWALVWSSGEVDQRLGDPSSDHIEEHFRYYMKNVWRKWWGKWLELGSLFTPRIQASDLPLSSAICRTTCAHFTFTFWLMFHTKFRLKAGKLLVHLKKQYVKVSMRGKFGKKRRKRYY